MGHTRMRTDEMHNGTTSHDRSTHRNEQLRILILEDVKADAELMVRALRHSGLEFAAHYVAGKESFHHQLDEFVPDLVLSDYEMPRYSGMDAIADVHERCPATPVIIVTGAVSDEIAVDCIDAGAEDYVLKDHLARLPTAVAKALERRSERERRLEAEAALRVLSEAAEPGMATAPITRLPDHGRLVARLGEVLGTTGGWHGHVAIVSLNLDRFRVINHTFGYDAADELLVEVADRVSGCLRQDATGARPADIVARIGADEFAVVLGGLSTVEDALVVIERIRGALARTFKLNGNEVSITACFGVAMSGASDDDPRELLRHASVALTRAKERGPDNQHVFRAGVDTWEEHRLRLENELREAVGREQLLLHCQPIVSIESGTIVGLEMLLRWEHPDLGLLSPLEFLPIAESSGLILPIGRWVLAEACRETQRLQERFPDTPLEVAVNISDREFHEPGFHESVRAVLADTGLEPGNLVLEITESLLTRSTTDLERLKDLGVKLAIDDFGTGNLSFSYLTHLSVDAIKIDGSLVQKLETDSQACTVVKAMLAAAKSLELHPIAEAVETPEQLAILKDLGCASAQGYLFAPPRPVEEMDALLETHPSW